MEINSMVRTGETPTKKRGILLEDGTEAPAKRICQENHTALLRRLQDVANDRGSHWVPCSAQVFPGCSARQRLTQPLPVSSARPSSYTSLPWSWPVSQRITLSLCTCQEGRGRRALRPCDHPSRGGKLIVRQQSASRLWRAAEKLFGAHSTPLSERFPPCHRNLSPFALAGAHTQGYHCLPIRSLTSGTHVSRELTLRCPANHVVVLQERPPQKPRLTSNMLAQPRSAGEGEMAISFSGPEGSCLNGFSPAAGGLVCPWKPAPCLALPLGHPVV